ncbi:uncharacterized protein Z518_06584 [Rhinocladiella mackenziei CBS 650.93]|uniref:Uncharacterized protein n=1 Tax=Rhinocladiella mackenziei CBS 650.93 TaxID=1442369 RepID=A0A0D2IB39_9EURO|nr:uncharacterized protein Z518_06584 [Rhinocladiella mackenziei CBS 650.93]KIX03034.1 hypothetical protein Z518_06584 [Rhinocladiella mackenziei CBS 650.93]
MEDTSIPPMPREDHGPHIPPAKWSTIEPEPTISIFYRPNKAAPLELLDGNLSRDSTMIFCDRIRHNLTENNSKSFTVMGGDLTGLKNVLEQSIVKFTEIDEITPKLFTTYANAITSAILLGIPARDLANDLTKCLLAIARKVLMDWDEVGWFHRTPTLNACSDQVRQVVAASVFWAWWNLQLDAEETPEDMMFPDALR